MQVTILIPPAEEGVLNDGLRRLTRHLARRGHGELKGGLGGSDGYGIEYENGVFLMHPFCWCEESNCPWCAVCECSDSTYRYYVDGNEVTEEDYFEFFNREIEPYRKKSIQEWLNAARRINERRRVEHYPDCDFCLKGLHPEKGTIPGKAAPNFWFKGSEEIKPLRIWWYKWIGRDMEVDRHVNEHEWNTILSLCLKSVPSLQ